MNRKKTATTAMKMVQLGKVSLKNRAYLVE